MKCEEVRTDVYDYDMFALSRNKVGTNNYMQNIYQSFEKCDLKIWNDTRKCRLL